MRRMGNGLLRFFAECWESVKRTFAGHLALYVCLVIFLPLTIAITTAYRAPWSLDASEGFLELVPQYFFAVMFFFAVAQYVILARKKSRSPLRDFGRWLRSTLLSNDRPGNVFHTIVTLTPLMVSFSVLKEDVPIIHPFTWDETFLSWDRALGFGRLPWEILQPLLGFPVVTAVINFAYDFWFITMFGMLIWQAFFARGTADRMQFLLAFAFSWFIAGNVLAVIFSSAGPCYYGYLHTPDPYAPQMAYLRATADQWPVWSVELQDLLWKSYTKTMGRNIGISAMPSMHIVMAVLVALAGWRMNKWWGAGLTVSAVIVIVGSIHLGWHYAVDGIAGTALALIFWWVAGVIVRAHLRLGEAAPAGAVAQTSN
jgi:hypothetical protein